MHAQGERIIDAPSFVNAVEHARRKGIARAIGAEDKLARYLRRWLRENLAVAGNRNGDDRAMHHDNIHGAIFQHLARRALAGRNIGHAAGQGVACPTSAPISPSLTMIRSRWGRQGRTSFASCTGSMLASSRLVLRPAARARLEHTLTQPFASSCHGRIHLLVNSGQAEMQIACGGGTEIKMIRRQNIGSPGTEDMSAPPGCLGDEGVGPLCGGF